MQQTPRELSAEEVSFHIPSDKIVELESHRNGSPIIGQPRAVEALSMGIDIRGKGYNVFVTGLPGTGKRSAILTLLRNAQPRGGQLKDIAVVYNFHKPDRPKVLYFPPGRAAAFRREMHRIVEEVKGRVVHGMEELEGGEAESPEEYTFRQEFFSALGTEVAEILKERIGRIRREFPEESVGTYLSGVEQDILQNLYLFSHEEPIKDFAGNPALIRYGVNVIVDRTGVDKAPVVLEKRPTYQNLIGTQETTIEAGGETRTSFMMLRAGSLIQASGGFLVLQAEDILEEEDAWNSLKWAIRDGTVEIQPQPTPSGAPGPFLKPEPIEVDVKIIMMGNEQLYDYLYNQDDEFQKLFKVPAEFDSVMVKSNDSMAEYISFIHKIVDDEKLFPFEPDGIAAVIEYGVRLSEHREQLSTRFSLIADMIRESAFWCGKEGKRSVGRMEVERAIRHRNYLFNLPEEKIDEQILNGELLMAVTGQAVGTVNGLAIMDRGYYSFGRPTVITARVAPGSDGIVNVEREVGLSGEIHDKGIFILQGFLRSRYSRSHPLSITGSICFEQSYIEVDGDSAASSEMYALLSAIAEVPLRQDLAVTGSFNQLGLIQPVGGVSEKVEGFYDLCCKLGLTGEQGVIIPEQNGQSLILRNDVQEAIREERFHVYAVRTIDDGISLLTGMEPGELSPKGNFPVGTFNHLVEKRLREIAAQVKAFGG